MKTASDPAIKRAIEEFVKFAQNTVDRGYPGHDTPPPLSIMWGRKYARIVRGEGMHRSVFGFVDLSNGNLLKAATWKKPAKHPRGNVLDKSTWANSHTSYGMAYMRSAAVIRPNDTLMTTFQTWWDQVGEKSGITFGEIDFNGKRLEIPWSKAEYGSGLARMNFVTGYLVLLREKQKVLQIQISRLKGRPITTVAAWLNRALIAAIAGQQFKLPPKEKMAGRGVAVKHWIHTTSTNGRKSKDSWLPKWGRPTKSNFIKIVKRREKDIQKAELRTSGGDLKWEWSPGKTAKAEVPQEVKDRAEEIKEKSPDYDTAKAFATAWSIYCKYTNPGSPHCKKDSPGEYFPKKAGRLRSELVRLAHAHPEFRDALLPLLAKKSSLRNLKVEVLGLRLVDVNPSPFGGMKLGYLGYMQEKELTTPGDKALIYPTVDYAREGDPVGYISKTFARRIFRQNR